MTSSGRQTLHPNSADRAEKDAAHTQLEDLWRGVLANPRIGIALADSDGRLLATNAKYQDLVGYSQEELGSMSFLDVTEPADQEGNQRLNAELMAGLRKDFQLEKRYRRKDGRLIWVRTSVSILPGPKRCTLALVEDITERRKAEEDLRTRERQLREAQALAHLGSWEWDPAGDGTAVWSDELRRIFGVGPDFEPSTETFLERVHPEDRDRTRQILRFSLEEVEAFSYEYRIVRSDGIRSIRTLSYVERDEWGGLKRLVGVAQDVTERARLEGELKRSEAYLAEGERLSHCGSWAWSVQTGELFWSQETRRILGMGPEEPAPTHALFLSTIHEEDRERVRLEVERCVRERSDYECRFRVVRPDGDIRHLHSLGRPSVDAAGEPVEYVGVAIDVTDARLAGERLKRSMEELRALSVRLQKVREEEARRIAREVHDEVGQSLTALAMDLAWLERKIGRRTRKEEILAKLEAMSRLVRSTTESVQRISSDLRPGVLDELGLEAAAEWAVRGFAQRTGVQCRFRPAVGRLAVDPASATAVFRILQESLTNVARHARATRVDVALTAEHGEVQLEVLDDGVGIPLSSIEDSASLGLLGMRERARSLGGTVEIGPAAQGGTAVCARIPL
jgi:PAS domain S-box-containing protein